MNALDVEDPGSGQSVPRPRESSNRRVFCCGTLAATAVYAVIAAVVAAVIVTASKDSSKKPGPDADFEPTHEWLEVALKVPLTSVSVKEIKGGSINGMSGVKYWKASIEVGGSEAHPKLGLPTNLFIKTRQPHQSPEEFMPENAVAAIQRYLPVPPPCARVLAGDADALLQEALEHEEISVMYLLSKLEMERVLESYAEFHSLFWGIKEVPGLKEQSKWLSLFSGLFAGKAKIDKYLSHFQVPNRELILRAWDELPFDRLFELMNSHGTTVVQGDAHKGQLLKVGKSDTGGTWKLIDFGNSVIANPAVDIGSVMQDLHFEDVAHEYDLVRHYWTKLTERLSALGVTPSGTVEEFIADYKVGAVFRGLFLMQAMGDLEYSADPFGPYLINFLRHLDEALFEDLAKRLPKAPPKGNLNFLGPSRAASASGIPQGFRLDPKLGLLSE